MGPGDPDKSLWARPLEAISQSRDSHAWIDQDRGDSHSKHREGTSQKLDARLDHENRFHAPFNSCTNESVAGAIDQLVEFFEGAFLPAILAILTNGNLLGTFLTVAAQSLRDTRFRRQRLGTDLHW